MAAPKSNPAGQINWLGKRRCGLARALKHLLTTLSHVCPKSKSRPNTLDQFDIVTLNSITYLNAQQRGSHILTPCETKSNLIESASAASRPRATKRGPFMADRVIDARLESLYEEEESCRAYIFASALQDAWHAQDIEALARSVILTLIFLYYANITTHCMLALNMGSIIL
jgi:hypothetical protein